MAQPNALTFVVEVDCLVQITAAFEAAVSGTGAGDFGSGDTYRVYVNEYNSAGDTLIASSVSTAKPMALARAKYGDQLTVAVEAGHSITAGLSLASATSHTVTAYNIETRVEVIKR